MAGTTADKLNKLQETKEDIRQAINEKGGNVTESQTFSSYGNAIRSLSTEIVVDDELSLTSENPVENKVVTSAINGKLTRVNFPSVVYCTDDTGTEDYIVFSQSNESGSIAQRDDNGNLQVSTPISDNDATNKAYLEAYVDNAISTAISGAIQTVIDGEY